MRRWLSRHRVLAALGALLVGLIGLVVIAEVAFAAWIYADLPGPPRPALRPIANVGSPSASTCAACHPQFVNEWQGSAHANAAASSLFQSQFRQEKQFYLCLYCHQPLVEQRPDVIKGILWVFPRLLLWKHRTPNYQPELAREGVTCLGCHARGDSIAGPHRIESPVHPVTHDPDFASNALCRTCHHLDIHVGASVQRPVQDTFAEWVAYRAAGGDKQCVDCHMPWVGDRSLMPGSPPRPSRSHAVRGPRDLEFLRTGLIVGDVIMRAAEDGGAQATLSLTNGTGHRLPTAEPRRRVEASIEALDAAGLVLKSSGIRIERKLDAEHLTEAPGTDSTLLPRERRQLELKLPAPMPPATQKLRVSVRFYLWDQTDALIREAGLDTSSLMLPVHETVRPWPLR